MTFHLLLYKQSNASVLFYDGPGHKSKIIYKNNNIQQFNIKPVTATTYRAMVQINMLIKGRIETKTYNNLEITCDAKDTDYNILLTSTENQHIYCMKLLHVTFREKKLFVPHVYPLLHINYFSFDGPLAISGSTNQNCQYGGLYIWRHMNNQSTYICEHIQNYTIYNDKKYMVIFLVWYSGHSRFRLYAQFRETACFTRYTAHGDILTSSMENTLYVSDSLPCQLIICTRLMSRKNSKYCTINTSTES